MLGKYREANSQHPYLDLDLIVIAPENMWLCAERKISDLIRVHYPNSQAQQKDEEMQHALKPETLSRTYLCPGNASIDLTISDSLEKAMVKPEYLNNNWFHQIV